MPISEILAGIDAEIDRLQQVKALLSGPSKTPPSQTAPKKRHFSATGLARIRAAQKARWAKAKEAAK
jgi:hypothetical protein